MRSMLEIQKKIFEVVDIGGPNELSGVDLNKPIEVDKFKTPPRKSPRRRIHMEKTPQQKSLYSLV